MMFRSLACVLAFVFALSITVDSNTQESLELKMFDINFSPSASELTGMLERAYFASHGYEKEVTTRLVQQPGNDKARYKKKHLYYKTVNCSQVQEVNEEILLLMPGAFVLDMITKNSREVRFRQVDDMQLCKVGLEAHFREQQGCFNNGKFSRCRRKRSIICGVCITTGGDEEVV